MKMSKRYLEEKSEDNPVNILSKFHFAAKKLN